MPENIYIHFRRLPEAGRGGQGGKGQGGKGARAEARGQAGEQGTERPRKSSRRLHHHLLDPHHIEQRPFAHYHTDTPRLFPPSLPTTYSPGRTRRISRTHTICLNLLVLVVDSHPRHRASAANTKPANGESPFQEPTVLDPEENQKSETDPGAGEGRGCATGRADIIYVSGTIKLSHPKSRPKDSNIEAPPSLLAQKKYCDVTGLEAKYTDPKTLLRYHSAEVYQHIRILGVTQVQEHLSVRGAAVVLR
ncbi:YL1 nuclear protein C-terminal domain-containing protein [Jimgerdemannia flammicorona]|uniref:YL1 nuclear protein C-terminal domain-containing protein n=1 Tax=Jimgerdemannia flammicorona TaxID=994334 RepID=A0A433D454_9FUNG|nr:YL1 nuclear protein C-terminal domain-containing protein [Jimgerdemannia flammicorona]